MAYAPSPVPQTPTYVTNPGNGAFPGAAAASMYSSAPTPPTPRSAHPGAPYQDSAREIEAAKRLAKAATIFPTCVQAMMAVDDASYRSIYLDRCFKSLDEEESVLLKNNPSSVPSPTASSTSPSALAPEPSTSTTSS